MEAQNPSKQSSLALRPKIKAALRQRFTKRGDAPAQAPSQDQEPAQHTQQEDKPAATQFHLFPDLPTELRVMIWAEATRYKRYVVLDPPNNSAIACARLARRHRTYPKPGYAGERRPMWTTRTPPPALLSVSREAREVALRTWQLAFGWHDVFPAAVVRRPFFFFFRDFVCRLCVALVPGRVGTAFSASETFAVFFLFAFTTPSPTQQRSKP